MIAHALALVIPLQASAQASATEPLVIPDPDPAAAEVPAGYAVDVALSGLTYPTSVDFDAAGTLYVAECGYAPGDPSRPARIYKATPDGAGFRLEVFFEGLAAPVTDIVWHEEKLYVSHKARISVLEGGVLRDLVTDLPSLGDHSNNQLAFGPDGKLYFGQGSATNSGVVGADNFAFGWVKEHPEVCEVPALDVVLTGETFETSDPRHAGGATVEAGVVKTSAFQPFGKSVPAGTVVKGQVKANGTILRVNPDGSGLEMFAWGLRNPYGVQWGPDGKLYVADAGSDERGSRPIAKEPEKLFVGKPGAWYGWPDFLAGAPATEPRFAPQGGPEPRFLLAEHPPLEKPLLTFEDHASVTQIAFSPGGSFGFEGALFLGASGDQSAVTAREEVRAGYWVKRVDPASGRADTFFRAKPEALGPQGLEYVTTAGPKRIVDVRFAPKGDALYAVDFGPIHYEKGAEGPQPRSFPGTGVVWRIRKTE